MQFPTPSAGSCMITAALGGGGWGSGLPVRATRHGGLDTPGSPARFGAPAGTHVVCPAMTVRTAVVVGALCAALAACSSGSKDEAAPPTPSPSATTASATPTSTPKPAPTRAVTP